MTLPRYLPAFTLTCARVARGRRYELHDPSAAGDTVLAWAPVVGARSDGVSFVRGPERAPAFSYAARGPGEFDVFDGRGEAIGYFRADHLSAPYLDARISVARRRLELDDEDRPVLRSSRGFGSSRSSVTVPDRRLALPLAAAVVVAIDWRKGR